MNGRVDAVRVAQDVTDVYSRKLVRPSAMHSRGLSK